MNGIVPVSIEIGDLAMSDVYFLLLGVTAFAVLALYARVCDRL